MIEADFPPESLSVRSARAFVESVSEIPIGLRGDVALLVSEMAANCVLHARSPFRVGVYHRPGLVRIEVTDASSKPPIIKAYSSEAPTGRGLRLIDALAARWGVNITEQGKTVWIEFDFTGLGAPLAAQ